MAERLVINTGPLLALARGNVLDVVSAVSLEIVCPPEVRAELDAGQRAGLTPIRPPWLTIV